jgi:heme-degrading monooxygenase HmoA
LLVYATVRTYSAASELADALVGKAADVKDLIKGIDGFKAYYLVRTADGAVSVSVYEDQAGADASTAAAAAFIRENLPDLSVAAPQVSAGEVVLDA